MANELEVVQLWLNAVNQRDGAALESFNHPDVEIVGPRGAGLMPQSVLSEWLLRSGFSAEADAGFAEATVSWWSNKPRYGMT